MKFVIAVVLMSWAALSSNSVFAQGYSEEYKQCLNTSYSQTATLKKCIDKEMKLQENFLSQYYKNYLKNSENHQSNIEQQHQLWINCVNQQCYFKVTSIYVDVRQAQCVLEMTMERAYYYQTKQMAYS